MSWVTAIVVSMASLAALIALVVAPVTAGSVPEPLRQSVRNGQDPAGR